MAIAFPYKGEFVHREIFGATKLTAAVSKWEIAKGLPYFAIYDDDYDTSVTDYSLCTNGGQYMVATSDITGATSSNIKPGVVLYYDSTNGKLAITGDIVAGYVVGDDPSVPSSVTTTVFAAA